MIKTVISKSGEELTSEEKIRFAKEVAEAKSRPISFDKDCEELSSAMQKAFRCVAGCRNKRHGVQ